jgi:hypothetical protein
MNPRHLVLFVLLAWSPYILGALQTWDLATFEASPANSDQVSQGDDKIRELKENIRDRAEVEHLWGTISSGGDNGRSREGNARVFYDNSEPSALSNSVTDTAGSAALDEGRLWRDADDGYLKVYSGSAWVNALTTLGGTIELLDTPRFATVDGEDAFNPLAFHIRAISTDTSMDADCAASGAVSTTAIASQTFGTAGIGCLSVSVDYSARSTSSRGIVFAQVNFDNGGTPQVGVYRDSMSNLVSTLNFDSSTSGSIKTIYVWGYVTAVDANTHEFALHASDSLGGGASFHSGSNATLGQLMYIDLGPEY